MSESFKLKINSFFERKIFIYIMAIVTYVSWCVMRFSHFPTYYISYSLFFLLLLVMLIIKKSLYPSSILFLYFCFLRDSLFNSFDDVPIYMIVIASSFLLTALIYVIFHYKKVKSAKIIKSWGLLLFVFLLSLLINFKTQSQYSLLLLITFILYPVLYLYFQQTIPGEQKDYIAEVVMIGGLICALQKITINLSYSDGLSNFPIYKGQGGWANGIITATIMWLAIGMESYLVIAEKGIKKIYPFIVVMLNIFAIILTGCRGAMLIMSTMILFFFIAYYKFSSNKKLFRYGIYCFILLIILGIAIFYKMALRLFDYIFKELQIESMSGRVPLWEEAFNNFNISWKTRIFGNSLGSLIVMGDSDLYFKSPHSAIMLVLETIGILGIIVFGFHLFETFKIFSKKKDPFSIFTLLTIVGSFLHSLFENVYFWPTFMICFLIIIGCEENNKIEIKKFNKPFKL